MYQTLTFYHSLWRWVVLASLLYALYRSGRGYFLHCGFSKTDNAVRHWTATIAHVQLLLGMLLYFQSPIVDYFWAHPSEGLSDPGLLFFGLVHMVLMLASIVLITIGSALAKRQSGDRQKFQTMLVWFALALIVIFMAVPWPFSPWAARPYFR